MLEDNNLSKNNKGIDALREGGSQGKKPFIFGMVAGVAAIALVGFLVMLGLYINQGETAGSDNSKAVAGNNLPAAAPGIQLQPVTEDDWVRGDRSAPISIIEFSDTECPFCKRHHPTLQRIVDEYDGQVNWVYRHLPLVSLHSKALREAEATECAGELAGNDGFWKYIDRLFEVTPANNGLDLAQLPEIAEEVGLNRAKFEECLDSGKYALKVKDHISQAQAAGGRGTPYNIILVGDEKILVNGAVPFEQFKAIIDEVLKNI